MIVRFLALSSAFLLSAALARVPAAGGVEPSGAVSSCGQVPRQVVGTAGTRDASPVVLPSNLEVDSAFRLFLDRLWKASPTFRGQWRRLAAVTGVRLSVLVEDRPRPSSFSNARTILKYQGGLLVSAHVSQTVVEAPELIAHELEHILEQPRWWTEVRVAWRGLEEYRVTSRRSAIEGAARRDVHHVRRDRHARLPQENPADLPATVVQQIATRRLRRCGQSV